MPIETLLKATYNAISAEPYAKHKQQTKTLLKYVNPFKNSISMDSWGHKQNKDEIHFIRYIYVRESHLFIV